MLKSRINSNVIIWQEYGINYKGTGAHYTRAAAILRPHILRRLLAALHRHRRRKTLSNNILLLL